MVVAPLLFALAASANAMLSSGECRPPKDSSEALLMAFFSAPIAFSPAGHANRLAPGAVRLSFDVTYVPSPPASIRRASFCNRKSENTELSPVFPRPRLALGLPGGFYVEGSYLPPVTVLDATPNLGSIALGWSHSLTGSESGPSTWVTLRAHATFGSVKGPITCSADAIQTTAINQQCYGNRPSDDTYRPNMMGGEGIVGWNANPRFSGYVGAGYTAIKPRFQVNFTSLLGTTDNTKLLLNDSRLAAFAGGRYRVHSRVNLTGELYSVPKDLTTLRFGASWMLRGAT